VSTSRVHSEIVGDVGRLVTSFGRSLRAANLAERTVQSYTEGVAQLHAFLEQQGMPTTIAAVRREHIEAWIEHLLASWRPSTAANR
jgi:site-specific recombinase XerD